MKPDWDDCSEYIKYLPKKNLHELSDLAIEVEREFIPFYEILLTRWPLPYPISVFFLVIPILAIHFSLGQVYRVKIFQDYSWFLAVMIGFIFVLVLWATKRLRTFVIDLYYVFGIDPSDRTLYSILRETLIIRSMIKYGVLFGGVNTIFGLFYGIWYDFIALNASVVVQFFIVGFVCGLAICGIAGVLRLVDYACSREDVHLDLTASDKCGGASIIGNMLLKFSAVSLLAGLFIAFYIYNSPWAHRGWFPVTYSIYLWMIFPHLAAIAVLLVPLLKLHNVLKANKAEQLTILSDKRAILREKMLGISDGTSVTAERQCRLLNTQYSILSDMCNELNEVRVWPYETGISFSFAIAWLLTLFVPLLEIWLRLSKMFNQ